ncbi:glycosyltransferase family 9 protein [Nitrospirillum sp. BR 11164]|uniref:glycosyltransferase family 9 protein n=1 Tax=Nitrospirillum sp. BR 11164 TaxID=3104324 RepID=UPI002AFEF334|nr:glycosyltransferase family 9 protein [Nitrospirillum sp. BR 11164]MEA1649674.1 glycosyltransferase family 9 protein [Nitrospirillum sp. BR 11164]
MTVAPAPDAQRILVIRLGALGDLVQCFDAFQAIRRHHPGAHVTLLTGPAFVGFGRAMPWFDDVWADPRGRSPLAYWRLRAQLRAGRFDTIYDLQNKPRTARYFWLMGPGRRPLWSGAARGAAFPLPSLTGLHNHDRYRVQLQAAGVPDTGPADLGWLAGDVDGLAPEGPFVLLVPGCSPHLPHKRWPAERYAMLGRRLADRGLTPVVVGTEADRDAAGAIVRGCPWAVDLVGRTSLGQLASLARRAEGAVGNDTGPIFLTAALGCSTLMIMSHHTDPARSAPWGSDAAWIKVLDLTDLGVDAVETALRLRPKPDVAPDGDADGEMDGENAPV